MMCLEDIELIKKYKLKELDKELTWKIDRHIKECPRCRNILKFDNTFFSYVNDEVETSDLTKRVMNSINKNNYLEKKSLFFHFFYRYKRNISLAASLFFIILIFTLLYTNNNIIVDMGKLFISGKSNNTNKINSSTFDNKENVINEVTKPDKNSTINNSKRIITKDFTFLGWKNNTKIAVRFENENWNMSILDNDIKNKILNSSINPEDLINISYYTMDNENIVTNIKIKSENDKIKKNTGLYNEFLCKNNETIIYSFLTNSEKRVSVCVANDKSYIQVRYGTMDNILTEYPQNKENSWQNFYYSYKNKNGKLDLENEFIFVYKDDKNTYTITGEYENNNPVSFELKIQDIENNNILLSEKSSEGIIGKFDEMQKFNDKMDILKS